MKEDLEDKAGKGNTLKTIGKSVAYYSGCTLVAAGLLVLSPVIVAGHLLIWFMVV